MIMRKFNWKKSVAIALSTVCMVGALAGCGSSSSDNGNDSAKACISILAISIKQQFAIYTNNIFRSCFEL